MQQLTLITFVFLLTACRTLAQDLLVPSDFIPPAIAYSPRSYSPAPGSTSPSQKQITEDLKLLVTTGFHSLLTYSAKGSLGTIPKIARQVGFDGFIVMGIWDPTSNEEWKNALEQARFVNAYCVGNEGLDVRYSKETLSQQMEKLRRATGHPVTTSEPIDEYLSGPHRDWLLLHSDWLFPIAHSYWAQQNKPKEAVSWIIARHDYLVTNTQKTVVIKEAGMPSINTKYNEKDLQIAFFEALESTGISFFYFEAFDQPWKSSFEHKQLVEAHWGLFDVEGSPKEVIGWITNWWNR